MSADDARERPLVAIVMLNWNGLDDTVECLASIREMTYERLQVIVVDNASRDGQAGAIREAFPEVVVLPQSENLGFCGGCNVGIKYALDHGADYVMLLNNDTLVPPDLIERLIDGAAELCSVAAVSPVILEHPDRDKVWFSRAQWCPERAQFSLAEATDSYAELSGLPPYESEFACGCCMLIPAGNFAKVGLLDERYFAFYDEAAWCANARQQGLISYTVPSAVMYHKVSKSTPSLVSKYLLTRNRLLWMKEALPVKVRLRSLKYLLTEFIWHARNSFSKGGGQFTPVESRIVVRGYLDYFLGRTYKWSSAAAKLFAMGAAPALKPPEANGVNGGT